MESPSVSPPTHVIILHQQQPGPDTADFLHQYDEQDVGDATFNNNLASLEQHTESRNESAINIPPLMEVDISESPPMPPEQIIDSLEKVESKEKWCLKPNKKQMIEVIESNHGPVSPEDIALEASTSKKGRTQSSVRSKHSNQRRFSILTQLVSRHNTARFELLRPNCGTCDAAAAPQTNAAFTPSNPNASCPLPAEDMPQCDIEVEATLVQDTRSPLCNAVPIPDWQQYSNPQQHYDSNHHDPKPWWQRHKIFLVGIMAMLFGALMATMGVFFSNNNEYSKNRKKTMSSERLRGSTTTTPPTQISTSTISSSTEAPSIPGKSTIPSTQKKDISTNPTIPSDNKPTAEATASTVLTTLSQQSCVRSLGTLFEADCSQCKPQLAIDGDTAVVSKPFESVDFFAVSNNSFELITSIQTDFDARSVAVYGNVAVVGAPFESGTGAVHVYERSSFGNWKEVARFLPNYIKSEKTYFGWAVSIYANVLVVGAPYYAEDWEHGGFAYVYQYDGKSWKFVTKLLPTNSTPYVYGAAVSVQDKTIAVGDYNQVFVYNFDSSSKSWEQFGGALVNRDCESWFGTSVELLSDFGLLIGCDDDTENKNSGAVYLYEQTNDGSNYIFLQKISASDKADNEVFGGWEKISADGGVFIAGTFLESGGKAYVFEKVENRWSEVAIIHQPESSDKYFGDGVALSGETILVYSRSNVYIYQIDLEYC